MTFDWTFFLLNQNTFLHISVYSLTLYIPLFFIKLQALKTHVWHELRGFNILKWAQQLARKTSEHSDNKASQTYNKAPHVLLCVQLS